MTEAPSTLTKLVRSVVLFVAGVALAGCHLIYPFTASAPDGGGQDPDGPLADHAVTDRSITSERPDLYPSSERGGDCCPPVDQAPPTCPPAPRWS